MMLDSTLLPALLAQEQNGWLDSAGRILYILAFLAAVTVLPFVLGSLIARALRMRGYEWRIGLILFSIFLSVTILGRSWEPAKEPVSEAILEEPLADPLEIPKDASEEEGGERPDKKWTDKLGRFNIPLGVDLEGGVILIYEVETESAVADADSPDVDAPPPIDMNALTQALTNRIDPGGMKEIVIRPYGDRQVEIIIPKVEAEEVRNIKRKISTAGSLEFRIVANERDHQDVIELARSQAADPDPARRIDRRVMQGREQVGFWAQAAEERLKATEVVGTTARNGSNGELIDFESLPRPPRGGRQKLEEFLAENGLESLDILVATNDGYNVTGSDLGVVSAGTDEYLQPCVNFRLRGAGIAKFRFLTTDNLPDTDATPPFYRHLGIMLDERLLSFPRLITTISDSGRITGDFPQAEVDFLVGILRAGRLPATLTKEPISENTIGSMLGDDTIQKGQMSIVVSLAAVLLFVAIYYQFAGIVACFALLTNLVMILATMVLLNAPLTLPGLAGLVLTVGMSVDANVLIFERIREEMARGAAMRMAIRNGFSKATTTIVDANVTTLITAMVLYAIGTDQIRGFAVTLILGILMSMYTAIFCSRVIFDIAERRHWISQLRMMRILGTTHLDFIGLQRVAVIGSIMMVVIGVVAVFVRGRDIFDIDFNGGVSVTMVLQESMPPDEVRRRLDDHFGDTSPPIRCTVNTVGVEGRPDNSVYKIDAPMESTRELERAIQTTFRDAAGASLLQAYRMDFTDVRSVTGALEGEEEQPVSPRAEALPVEPPGDPPVPEAESGESPSGAAPDAGGAPEPSPPADDPTSKRRDLPSDTLLAYALSPPSTEAQEADGETDPPADADEDVDATPPATATDGEDLEAPVEAPEPAQDAPADAGRMGGARSVAQLTFGDRINAPTLRYRIRLAYTRIHGDPEEVADPADPLDDAELLEVPGLLVDTGDLFVWDQNSSVTSKEWYVTMFGPEEELAQVLERVKTDMAQTPVFPSSSSIGGKVAGDTRNLAVAAMVASLFGILAYIWIRFQRVVFGVAAVIALVHDMLIVVGAIAISAYVSRYFGFLLIDEFKINLPMVAALLTIMGYSLNDTIVIFDRIREVRGKSPDLTPDMINLSVNQTLSRTLLTSLTTLIVAVILYAAGGQGIHGFAFALVVGVLVGTYSSVFIAAPALLWLFNRARVAD